ncbi:MAG: CHAT domain-containing protein [Syntrophobacteraceae bacterium]|nr:CHAT domain-containing protein [Syntrophobacteraceae bacterium]
MASESQRMGFVKTLRGEMDSFLSLIVQSLSNSPKAVMTGLDLVLKRKAIVAEALATERDAVLGGRYPELEPKLRQLKTLRIQIGQKILSGPGPEGPDAHRELLTKWEAEKEKLEVDLASRIPEINLEKRLADADRQAVAKALPPGTALVEFIRFDPFDFRAIPAKKESPWKPARYLAFVMPSGEPENIVMIDLGAADSIDRMISDFRSSITGESEKPDGRGITTKRDGRVRGDTAANLRGAVFDSLLRGLGGRKRVFLAPDGDLHRLPFAALPMEANRCLIDEYLISYVGSGRDVLRFGSNSKLKPSAPLVMADPDYDLDTGLQAAQPDKTAPSGRQSRDFMGMAPHFNRLPGTRTEGERVAALLDVNPLLDRHASKGQLKEHPSPRILHVATHGFFLPDQAGPVSGGDPKADSGGESANRRAGPLIRSMENPLLRSGLVLAGANTWVQGKRPPPEAGDGILTGEDASGLDLLSTELVVLSACETGLGDIRSGEGVFGLRRALLLAGAKTLVMSLWKVPDSQTQMLMEHFYKRVLEGHPRADALREAQLAIKAIFPETFYWGAFISQGDPGPLPPQGKRE